ncbi:hypothetical protein SprV_0200708300 [Sparganum proliferum]
MLKKATWFHSPIAALAAAELCSHQVARLAGHVGGKGDPGYRLVDRPSHCFLQDEDPSTATQETSRSRLSSLPVAVAAAVAFAAGENASVENRWCQLGDIVQSTALTILGRACYQHRDWFDDNDAVITNLFVEKNRLHRAYLDRPTDANRSAFYQCHRVAQQRLREIQENCIAGLPKIHKHGLPLRPILDMRNLPYHTIAKWLVEKLKPLQSHLYPLSLKDSFEFVEAIKDINVDGRRMLSLDVASLFTNVPVVETINYLCDVIRDTNYPLGMPVETLKELLTRCTQNVQFLCNGQLYRQIDGVAMGSPLGPFLANVFMGKVERPSLQDTINGLKFYGRYVDDIFCLTDITT